VGVTNTGGIIVTGSGTGAALLGDGGTDVTSNSYIGTTTVASGNLVANKASGAIAIPGDLVIHAGATFRYAGNNAGNQIADTARVTIDGGSFGDITAAGINPTNPGAPDTVAEVTLTANGGNFSSGRAAFTITGALTVLGGRALAHRAGTINANQVIVAGGSIDLDGGSTTDGAQSRLNVGFLGLTLANGTINLNSHASVASVDSVGSIVTLNGDVTSTGTSLIADIRTAVMTAAEATVDLGGVDRGFDVTGTLTIGSNVALTNGGVVKDGTGDLVFNGSQTLSSLTINDGVVRLGVATAPPSPDPEIGFGGDTALLKDGLVAAGSVLSVPEPGPLSLFAASLFGWLSCRRRPALRSA
jgi:autotransporter-associated beta strand protein